MLVVLKIPVVMAGLIVWWAIRSEPAPAEDIAPGEGGGGVHPRRPRPRPPRRGDHAEVPPAAPARVRVLDGRSRARTR